jgi:hypothetical protein
VAGSVVSIAPEPRSGLSVAILDDFKFAFRLARDTSIESYQCVARTVEPKVRRVGSCALHVAVRYPVVDRSPIVQLGGSLALKKAADHSSGVGGLASRGSALHSKSLV